MRTGSRGPVVLIGVVTLATWAAAPGAVRAGAQNVVSSRCGEADTVVARARQATERGEALAGVEVQYRHALDLCSSHPEALNNLADTLERMGRFDEAVAYYQRAAEAYARAGAPANLRALPLFGIGDAYRKAGRNGEALYWYRAGLDIEPNDPATIDAVRELTRDDPPGLVGARSIAAALDTDSRAVGVMAAVELGEHVLPFAFDSAELLPSARPQLRELAHALIDRLGGARSFGVLSAAGPPVARIAGHADTRGTAEYNQDLAQRRAQAVVDALVSEYRIPRQRLIVASHGESQPKCRDETEACHARNRRVEISRP